MRKNKQQARKIALIKKEVRRAKDEHGNFTFHGQEAMEELNELRRRAHEYAKREGGTHNPSFEGMMWAYCNAPGTGMFDMELREKFRIIWRSKGGEYRLSF